MIHRLFHGAVLALIRLLGRDFKAEVTEARVVPSIEDSTLTFVNLDDQSHKVKTIETCVLFIDIRDSTKLNQQLSPDVLSRLYALFVKSMIEVAEFYGGAVRNIIGDRLMVVFDKENCFSNAVLTAALMQSVSTHLLAPMLKQILDFDFRCGVGIAHGKMLVCKVGARRHGDERNDYRSLVWLGPPANVASKLTDHANKVEVHKEPTVQVGYSPGVAGNLVWREETVSDFLSKLNPGLLSSNLQHAVPAFRTFFQSYNVGGVRSYPAILVTKEVLEGFMRERPDDASIQNGWWWKVDFPKEACDVEVYGANVYIAAVDDYLRWLNGR